MAENIPPSTGAAVSSSGAIATTTATATTNTATATSTSHRTADQPGRPYYESLRTTLRATLEKKRRLDEQLAALEDQLFKSEGSYLEETSGSGNIVRGFDAWVKGVQISARTGGMGVGGGAVGDERRRGGGGAGAGAGAGGRVREEDRVFSRSSVGWLKLQDGTSDSATPSTAPTPSATTAPASALNGGGGGREGQTPTSATAAPKASNNKKKRPAASSSSATTTTNHNSTSASTSKEKKESGDDDDGDGNTKGVKRGKITYARD